MESYRKSQNSMILFRMRATTLMAVLCLLFGAIERAEAVPFFDTVVSFSPGSGSGIYDMPGIFPGPTGPGTYDPAAVTAHDGVILALGSNPYGSIVLTFSSGYVIDGPGDDLKVYDSFGLTEGFSLDVSNDGNTFFTVGTFDGSTAVTEAYSFGPSFVTSVDIAPSGLSSARFIRIIAAPVVVFAFPEAYDLDAVEALNFVPEPVSLLLVGLGGLALARRRRR